MLNQKLNKIPRLNAFLTKTLLPVSAPALFLLVWHILREANAVPRFMLPGPAETARSLVNEFPLLMRHIRVTLFEAGAGLIFAIAAAFLLALTMDNCRPLKKALQPFLLLTQTMPAIAVAPVLVLWLGYESAPKIALVFLTCFFPITVSLVNGFDCADINAIMLLKSMGAGRFHIYRWLKLPQALPSFFAGLRIAASYAIIGAVIAEWLGGSAGLGVYMTRVRKSYSFDKMFACILLVMLLSLALLAVVSALECAALPWKRRKE
ncbi:MAG: ABC transporter permease [Spirochaetaceae bacterium]|jgi:ABC-type nitrate/sulfonate/bicarbonate transport system permease component|nr:ABC transporter permease [Spirochaetaceae bacterium]